MTTFPGITPGTRNSGHNVTGPHGWEINQGQNDVV